MPNSSQARPSKTTAAPVTALVIPPAVEKSAQLAVTSISDHARGLSISNDSEYAAAGGFLVTVVKPALAQLDIDFDEIVSEAHKTHKKLVALKKKYATPMLEAESAIKRMMATYHAQVIARQEAERRRLEQSMREEAERQAAEEAARLLESGDEKGAETMLADLADGKVEAVTAPPPLVTHGPHASGTSVRMLKRWRVTDVTKIKRAYLVPDEAMIGKLVNAMGSGAEEVVGGIQVYEVSSVSAAVGR